MKAGQLILNMTVLQAVPTAEQIKLALLNGFVSWGLTFFGILAAMTFQQVRADPWAALFGASVPAAVVFFSRLQDQLDGNGDERDETPSDAPADALPPP